VRSGLAAEPDAILRGKKSLVEKFRAIDQLNSGFREFSIDFFDRSVQVDSTTGVAEDDSPQAEAACIKRRVADAKIVGETGEKDTGQVAFAEVSAQTRWGNAIILEESRV